jgi:hypothetical protein
MHALERNEEVLMTIAMTRDGRWSQGADVSPTTADVTISANRKRLDRGAPNLAFTISTRKAFVEVILATDRALFDPQNAPRRTPHEFFASRAFGLTPVHGADATYIVPTAVLRAFIEAQPRPREIFFTAIGYDDDQGHGPALAMPLAQLLFAAPSVPLAADYTVQGLARSFGMALERLVRHSEASATGEVFEQASPAPEGTTSQWRGSGRIVLPAAQSADDEGDASMATSLEDIDADGFDRDAPITRTTAYQADSDDDAPAVQNGQGGAAMAASDFEYDDGFGAADDDSPGVEPAELRDDDDDHASSYGDEADDDARAQAAATNGAASGTTPVSPRPPPPTASQLQGVLERVARTLDGQSLYTLGRRTNDGLRFGIGAFDQRSGSLGRLVAQMKSADPAAFARFFGDAADALVAVTGAPTADGRMANVGGRPLTDEAWIRRFAAAGAHPAFVRVQNELLVATVLTPMWPVLNGLGLTTDRALAVALVLGIQMGALEAADWLASRLAPAHTEAQLRLALGALGAPDLAAFQRQVGLADTGGRMDPDTKAALAGALRGLGASSPLPVFTPVQMLDAIRRHAGHGGIARKIDSLLEERSHSDRPR